MAAGQDVRGGGGAAPFLVFRLAGFTGTGDSDPLSSGGGSSVGEVGGGGAG